MRWLNACNQSSLSSTGLGITVGVSELGCFLSQYIDRVLCNIVVQYAPHFPSKTFNLRSASSFAFSDVLGLLIALCMSQVSDCFSWKDVLSHQR